MSEQESKEPKKYYEYYTTWTRAEKERSKHERNGRKTCESPMKHDDDDPREWRIWYQREQNTMRVSTMNARVYDREYDK